MYKDIYPRRYSELTTNNIMDSVQIRIEFNFDSMEYELTIYFLRLPPCSK